MRDYVNFGWRACFAGIVFDLLSLCAVFLVSKNMYGLIVGDRFYIASGVVLFVVITIMGLICRQLYIKGLKKRFPDTQVSHSAFLFMLYGVALIVAIVLGIVAMLIMVLLMQEMQAGRIGDTYYGIDIYLLYMGASSATYFYFLLYTTATVEYLWRQFLQKNVALIKTADSTEPVDTYDLVTAIIEAGENSLDNSRLKRLGDVDDFKEKVQTARGKTAYSADSAVHGKEDANMEVEGSKSSV